MSRTYHQDGAPPKPGQIFCFGSNLSGIHGAGAALAAHSFYGAEWGVGEGRTGQSYALPTVRHGIAGPLSLPEIADAVARFLAHATAHSELLFFVTRVGCGLAGHNDSDIAPMFAGAPANCSLPRPWAEFLEEESEV